MNVRIILFLLLLTSCSTPDEKVSVDSKTEACSQNIIGALSAFSSELGLPINISSEDATEIFSNGRLSKKYGRDGYRYTVYFGLETKEDGCSLVFYKQDKKGPGIDISTYSDYGYSLLEDCRCD